MQQIEPFMGKSGNQKRLTANIEYQNSNLCRKTMLCGLECMKILLGRLILTKVKSLTLKEEFMERIDTAKQLIEQLTSDKSGIQHGLKKQQSWLSQFREYKNISEISRIIVVNLIERINIFENAEIEVVFRQRDQFADIMSFLEEQEQKKAAKGAIPFPGLEVV